MKKLNARIIILLVFFAVIAFPMISGHLHLIESGKLNGYNGATADTGFTLERWWSGAYQESKTQYLNDSISLRPDLVRMNNELDYLAFGKLHANDVSMGKNGYLYEWPYISAWYGLDYIGRAAAIEKLRKLRYIQDTLARAGKTILLAFAPSKARYYPENLPPNTTNLLVGPNNYTLIKGLCDTMGIQYCDFNGLFLSLKGKTRHPLYYKSGIHWSYYGTDIAMDTLHRYINRISRWRIPAMSWDDKETKETDEPEGTDNDIESSLNLIWPHEKEKFYYNLLHFDTAGSKPPKVLFISDSYYWIILYRHIPESCYKSWEAWFYFNDIWTKDGAIGKISGQPWIDRLKDKDVIIIMATEFNLIDLGYGFIDKAYVKLGGR